MMQTTQILYLVSFIFCSGRKAHVADETDSTIKLPVRRRLYRSFVFVSFTEYSLEHELQVCEGALFK